MTLGASFLFITFIIIIIYDREFYYWRSSSFSYIRVRAERLLKYPIRLSVCLYVWKTSESAELGIVKSYVGEFYQNIVE